MQWNRLFVVAFTGLAAAVSLPGAAPAFGPLEPTEFFLWKQGVFLSGESHRTEPKLRAEIGGRQFVLTDEAVQLGTSPSSASPNYALDARLQYGLVQSREWGRLEAYSGPRFDWSEDAADRAKITAGLAYSPREDLRLELLERRELNLGAKHPGRGLSETRLGLSYLLWESYDRTLVADVFGYYLLRGNTSTQVSNQLNIGDHIRYDFGAHVFGFGVPSHAVIPFIALRWQADGSFRTSQTAISPGLRFNVGEWLGLLPLSLEVTGAIVTDYRKVERSVWLRVLLGLR